MNLYTKFINSIIKKLLFNEIITLVFFLALTLLHFLMFIYFSKLNIVHVKINIFLILLLPLFLIYIQFIILQKKSEFIGFFSSNTKNPYLEKLFLYSSIIPLIGTGAMSIRLYYLLVDIKKRVEKGEIKLD